MNRKPELLAPAGDLDRLKIAITYGADAVFIGGQQYGLRSRAGNFTRSEMEEAVSFAAMHGAKVYVAANMIAHPGDAEGADDFFRMLEEIGISAAIISDPGLIEIARGAAPSLPIHLSTQASTTNSDALAFWKEEGVERVVLAREVSLQEIKRMKDKVDIELETFIQGAMCMSYSGRCTLSNHMAERDANRGGCAQSCRWDYTFEEDGRIFTMGAADMMMLRHIPELIRSGIDSFKIEGRMKSAYYVATVVRIYRQVIDRFHEEGERFRFDPAWESELRDAMTRETSTGFYFGEPTIADLQRKRRAQKKFLGRVVDTDGTTGRVRVEPRNAFSVGDEIHCFGPAMESMVLSVRSITTLEGERIERAATPMRHVFVELDHPLGEDWFLTSDV